MGTSTSAYPGLPERCYGVLADTGALIIIKKGEMGYYRTSVDMGSKEENRALADEYNEKMGVSKAQAAAMSVGSMFGWDVPGADPKWYDEQGHLMKRASVREQLAAAKAAQTDRPAVQHHSKDKNAR